MKFSKILGFFKSKKVKDDIISTPHPSISSISSSEDDIVDLRNKRKKNRTGDKKIIIFIVGVVVFCFISLIAATFYFFKAKTSGSNAGHYSSFTKQEESAKLSSSFPQASNSNIEKNMTGGGNGDTGLSPNGRTEIDTHSVAQNPQVLPESSPAPITPPVLTTTDKDMNVAKDSSAESVSKLDISSSKTGNYQQKIIGQINTELSDIGEITKSTVNAKRPPIDFQSMEKYKKDTDFDNERVINEAKQIKAKTEIISSLMDIYKKMGDVLDKKKEGGEMSSLAAALGKNTTATNQSARPPAPVPLTPEMSLRNLVNQISVVQPGVIFFANSSPLPLGGVYNGYKLSKIDIISRVFVFDKISKTKGPQTVMVNF